MKRPRGTYTEADLIERLRDFEREYAMPSDDFFARWEGGELPFTDAYFSWAGLCGRLGVRERELA